MFFFFWRRGGCVLGWKVRKRGGGFRREREREKGGRYGQMKETEPLRIAKYILRAF